jgi:hypothetical protein
VAWGCQWQSKSGLSCRKIEQLPMLEELPSVVQTHLLHKQDQDLELTIRFTILFTALHLNHCPPSTADAKESHRRLNVLNIFTNIPDRSGNCGQPAAFDNIAVCVGRRMNYLESLHLSIQLTRNSTITFKIELIFFSCSLSLPSEKHLCTDPVCKKRLFPLRVG